MKSMQHPTNILIAGGGVAGLEALLGLHSLAADRVHLTLVAPTSEFSYKPLAVAEPFSLGSAHRVQLERFTEPMGAELLLDAVTGVDDAARLVHLRDGGTRSFDALLVAPGARPVAGPAGALTWWPEGDPDAFGGLLRDLEEGYAKRLAIVVPAGATWPLPAYELALMTAREARGMGHDDVEVTVVTPESAPLALFGVEAVAAIAEELARAGVAVKTGVVAHVDQGTLVLEPGGERLAGHRIVSIPRLLGPALDGLPADDDGFILAGDDARVVGCEHIWAAGDGVRSPVKFGGLATHQARCAVAAMARAAGVENVPDPGEPVLEGLLLIGDRAAEEGGGADDERALLWWPAGKVAGQYLPRWLAEHGVAPTATKVMPAGGMRIHQSLDGMRDAHAQHVSG